jgi:hypothetical protein
MAIQMCLIDLDRSVDVGRISTKRLSSIGQGETIILDNGETSETRKHWINIQNSTKSVLGNLISGTRGV